MVLFSDVNTAFNMRFSSSCPTPVLVRFVIMLVLNLWVTATVLRYRKAGVKAE